MNEVLLGVGTTRGGTPTGGQVIFDVAGTYTWEVPEDVNEISILVVQAGSGARKTRSNHYSGAGGNLRYINNVAVESNSILNIQVGSGGTTRLRFVQSEYSAGGGGHSSVSPIGISSNSSFSDSIHGGDGAPGKSGGPTLSLGGGWVGRLTSTESTLVGIDLTTCQLRGGHSRVTRANGAGGDLVFNSSTGRDIYKGQDGGVKIIWGENRAFPDLNVHNI